MLPGPSWPLPSSHPTFVELPRFERRRESYLKDDECRAAWPLFSEVTEVRKQVNPHAACRRGEALSGLFDAETGVHCRS
jgi:hypothetical protein